MDKKLLDKVVNEKQINSIIKSGDLGGLYFIFGDENHLKLHYANEIAKKSVDENFVDFNLHKFDGTTVTLETIKDAVETLPMFNKGTCVLINDLPINGLVKSEYDNLKSILNSIPSSCSFILLMDTVDKKKSKAKDTEKINPSDKNEDIPDNKVDAWEEILEIAVTKGLAIELNKRPASLLAGQLVRKAAEKGIRFDERDAFYLVQSVGNDISTLYSELDKICSYNKDGNLTASDIDAVAVKTVEIRIYEMVNSLIDGNTNAAYRILDVLFSQKVEPVVIVGTLISPFVDMYRVKTALLAGLRPDDAAGYFDYYKREFKLNNLSAGVKSTSVIQISSCLDLLDEADTLLKTSALDKRIIIEQTMARIAYTLSKNLVQ